MRIRRNKREVFARRAKMVLKIAALFAASWWGLRTLPEVVRYVRMERM